MGSGLEFCHFVPRLKRHIKSEALWQCGVPAFLKKSQPPLWAAIPVCVIVRGVGFLIGVYGKTQDPTPFFLLYVD
jgi:hypothetical protein